jgi:hypothetical protein
MPNVSGKSDRRRRHPSPSSSETLTESCSSESSIDSEIRRLQEKKEKRDARRAKKLECLEHKIEDNKKKDRQVEHKVEKLEHKLKKNEYLDRKWRLKYRTIVNRLRREKCLMVNGSDAFGSFYCLNIQTIQPLAPVIFEQGHNILNVELTPAKDAVKILRSGVYVCNINTQFDQPAQLAFFVNDTPNITTVTSSNSGAHLVNTYQLMELKAGDLISYRSYISNVPITTSMPASGSFTGGQNVDFTLHRIAPIPEACCIPPCINDKAWCDFESSDSHHSDSHHSDSECSHSSKFCVEEPKCKSPKHKSKSKSKN